MLVKGLSKKEHMKTGVYFILDLDRVLFDTERLYESRRRQAEEAFFSFAEDEGALEDLESLGVVSIFSEVTVNGSFELQREKIRRLGLDIRIAEEHTHIGEKKILRFRELLKKYKGLVFLVDDKVEVLEEARKIEQAEKLGSEVLTVWIQRGEHAKRALERGVTFVPNFKFSNLKDFVPVAKAIINTWRIPLAKESLK